MDIIKAFTYSFKEKNWYYNLLIGAIIAFPLCISQYLFDLADKNPFNFPYLLISTVYCICTAVVGIFLNGYLCANAHYRLNHTETPHISWKNLDIIIISGLKALFANIIYKIPLIIILFIGFIATLFAMFDVFNNDPSDVFYNTLNIISALSYLIEVFIIPSFIVDLKLHSLFNFRRIGTLIKNNPTGFLILLITSLLLTGTYTLLNKYFRLTPEIWVFINSFLTFYIITVKSDLFTQFVSDEN